jgi:hypothetical protein
VLHLGIAFAPVPPDFRHVGRLSVAGLVIELEPDI